MPARLKAKLTYANVMATIAVFFALGGASYAAIKVPRGSVGPKQLKQGAVSTPKIAAGAVTGSKLADGAVSGPKLATGAVSAPSIAAGAVTGSALAPDSVGSGNLLDGSVGSSEISDGSVGPADLTPHEAPISPTLEDCVSGTPWASAGTGIDPHYWKDSSGIVHLEGAVSCSGTASGGTIFQMPAVYRPAQNVVRFGVLAGGLSMAQVAVVINPFTAGVVYDGATNGTTSDNYVSLEGITYRAN